jgi:hypothetical protein
MLIYYGTCRLTAVALIFNPHRSEFCTQDINYTNTKNKSPEQYWLSSCFSKGKPYKNEGKEWQ